MDKVKRGPKPKKLVSTVWSPNLAYAIGLVATDGCLAKHTTLVDLTSKDREQLENFNRCLALKLKIGIKKADNGKFALRVQVKNRIFYDFLLSIGLTPAKSKTLGELRIPDKYYFDFLRGCFDGDGCFYSYWDSRWKSSFMFYTELVSASPKFIDWIREKNGELLGIDGHLAHNKRKTTTQLKYAKRESLLLLRKMYYSHDSIYLTRKKLKIDKALGIIGESI